MLSHHFVPANQAEWAALIVAMDDALRERLDVCYFRGFQRFAGDLWLARAELRSPAALPAACGTPHPAGLVLRLTAANPRDPLKTVCYQRLQPKLKFFGKWTASSLNAPCPRTSWH